MAKNFLKSNINFHFFETLSEFVFTGLSNVPILFPEETMKGQIFFACEQKMSFSFTNFEI